MNFLRDFYYWTVVSGGVYLIYNKIIDVPDLLSFILYVGIILPPIDRLINFVEQYQQGAAAFERFLEIMDIEPDIKDKKDAYSLKKLKGEIVFENVWFKYSTSPDWILKDVSFKIEPEQKVAFVGESGAGKTTIVSLIPRFYEPEEGKICIDGHDITNLKQKFLRKNI